MERMGNLPTLRSCLQHHQQRVGGKLCQGQPGWQRGTGGRGVTNGTGDRNGTNGTGDTGGRGDTGGTVSFSSLAEARAAQSPSLTLGFQSCCCENGIFPLLGVLFWVGQNQGQPNRARSLPVPSAAQSPLELSPCSGVSHFSLV